MTWLPEARHLGHAANQFPSRKERNMSGQRKWRCLVCDFVYEEALGMPDEGIPPGTAWDDVPDDWTCPDCGAPKSDFEMVEI